MSFIASVFPGLFTWSDFKKLDLRELIIWQQEARKREIEKLIEKMSIARSANIKDRQFNDQISVLKEKLSLMKQKSKGSDGILQNWKDLKSGL